jgi:hypothetical protein
MIVPLAAMSESLAQTGAAGDRTKVSAVLRYHGYPFHTNCGFLGKNRNDTRIRLVDGEVIHLASWFPA